MASTVLFKFHFYRVELSCLALFGTMTSFLLFHQRPNAHTLQRYLHERAVFDDKLAVELKRRYVEVQCDERLLYARGSLRSRDRPNEEFSPPRHFVGILRNVWREC